MRETGVADELALARAAAALGEMISYLACLVHDDFNADGVRDHRVPLPETKPPALGAEGLAEYRRLAPEDAWTEEWGSELFDSFRTARL
jgi:hypothetical protein